MCSSDLKRIAVLGMPNTGKSTFFNRFTGAKASIANWPGMTVDLMVASLNLDDAEVEVVDLPGIYDLQGFSQDEAVVQKFLATTPVNLVIIVINATQIDHQLSLALQVKHLGLPAVLLLNMADEAPKFGVKIEAEVIASHLAMPVVLLSAKYGHGYQMAVGTITQVLQQQQTPAVCLGELGDRQLPQPELEAQIDRVLQRAVQLPQRPPQTLTNRLDRVLLHPLWGLPLFFAAMYLMFQAVYSLGTPLQDGLGYGLEWVRRVALEPALTPLPAFVKGFLIGGLYDGVGAVVAFVPIILVFFMAMAIIEDSGYLARSAFLMDAFMERLGLDGRSFVMALMGFG